MSADGETPPGVVLQLRQFERASVEAEQATLAGIMLDPQMLRTLAYLRPGDFAAHEWHSRLWAAAITLADDGAAADPITLAHAFAQSSGIDAGEIRAYLGRCLDSMPPSFDTAAYARVVASRSRRRQVAALGRQIASSGEADAIVPLLAGLVGLADHERRSRYSLLSGADLQALPPMGWRVKGVLPAEGIAAIYGASMSGKSFLAFDLACAIAEGANWFGARTTPCSVVYLALEGEAGYRVRARAWCEHHGRPIPAGLRFVVQRFALTGPADVIELGAAIEGADCKLLVVDTLNRAAPGLDENSSKDMGAVIDASKALQARIGGLVLLVAHTGKDPDKGLRGHSSLIAALDAAILVKRDDTSRTWESAKIKDGADGDSHGFKLRVVELGIDDDGDDVTSCVVERDDDRPQPKRRLTISERTALRAFDAAVAAAGRIDRLGNCLGVHVEDWRISFYSSSTADAQQAKRMAFARARVGLVDKAILAVSDDVYRRLDGSH